MISKINFNQIDLSTPIGKLIILFILVIFISYLINILLARSFFGSVYRVFVAPGIILHELSHALLCFLTGAKISKVSFFEKDGGHVEHKPSMIPILGQILISLAPFAIGVLAIYFLSAKIGVWNSTIELKNFSIPEIWQSCRSLISNLKIINYQSWIIVYLVLSIAVTMTPSTQDLKNIIISVLIMSVAAYLAVKFIHFHIFSLAVPAPVMTLLSTVLILLIFSLALSIVIYVISKIVKPV